MEPLIHQIDFQLALATHLREGEQSGLAMMHIPEILDHFHAGRHPTGFEVGLQHSGLVQIKLQAQCIGQLELLKQVAHLAG